MSQPGVSGVYCPEKNLNCYKDGCGNAFLVLLAGGSWAGEAPFLQHPGIPPSGDDTIVPLHSLRGWVCGGGGARPGSSSSCSSTIALKVRSQCHSKLRADGQPPSQQSLGWVCPFNVPTSWKVEAPSRTRVAWVVSILVSSVYTVPAEANGESRNPDAVNILSESSHSTASLPTQEPCEKKVSVADLHICPFSSYLHLR